MKDINVTPGLIKQLEKQGFKIKPKRNLIRKTFVVEADALVAFLEAREKANIKLQDATTEALLAWAKKNK